MLLELISRLLSTLLLVSLIYTIYVSVERLLLSPIRHIPGPKIAALTTWYETYFDVFKPGQYVFEIQKLHKVYGPIVRITPRQISISDPNFLDSIYEGGPNSKRDKDYEMVKAMGFNSSVGGAWQHDLHKKRRQSLNNFFSQGMVLKFEPELLKKTQQLSQIFQDAQGMGAEVNLSDVYFGYASDVVNQFIFGYNQNVLLALPRAHAMRSNVARTLQNAKVNLQFSWFRKLVMFLPRRLKAHFAPGAIDMVRFRKSIRKNIQDLANEDTSAKPANPSIFRELLDSPVLPPEEKMIGRLEDEGTLMIMAGTESPAKSIAIAHFHLLNQPIIMNRLRSELGSIDGVPKLVQLLQLPYLNAIAIEANRLSFGLTGRNSRVAHETLIYTNPQSQRSYEIPPGTPLSTSTLIAHTDESIFKDPWTFNPDRWLGQEGQSRRKYMLSFGKGTRMCIGMNLANAELAMAIAEMARWNMRLWKTDERDVSFEHDWHVAHARLGSEGVRVKVDKIV